MRSKGEGERERGREGGREGREREREREREEEEERGGERNRGRGREVRGWREGSENAVYTESLVLALTLLVRYLLGSDIVTYKSRSML